MKQLLTAIITGLVLVAILVLLSFPFGRKTVPHIGSFFSERLGIWQNVRQAEFDIEEIKTSSMLEDTVKIYRDLHGIPHIRASNRSDALWALGYVTATDRYFQLFLLPNIVAGKTASWFGDDFIETDKAFLNLGLEKMAWDIHNQLSEDEYEFIRAYQSGINSYINSEFSSRKPMEFKMLNLDNRYWRPIDVIRTLLFWRYLTAYSEQDIAFQQAIDSLGSNAFNQYYGRRDSAAERVDLDMAEISRFQKSQSAKRHRFFGTGYQRVEAVLTAQSSATSPESRYDVNLTTPITLPTLFYEVHISLPNSSRYGITLPGMPVFLYGMNEHVFFGQVNSDPDPVNYNALDAEALLRDSVLKTRRYSIVSNSGKTVSHSVDFIPEGPVHTFSNSQLIMNWKGSRYKKNLTALWELSGLSRADAGQPLFKNMDGPTTAYMIGDNKQVQLIETGTREPVKTGIHPYQPDYRIYPSHVSQVKPETGFTFLHSVTDFDNQYFWRQMRLDSLQSTLHTTGRMSTNIPEDVVLAYKIIIDYLRKSIPKNEISQLQEFIDEIEGWNYTAGSNSKIPILLEKFMPIIRSKIWDELGDLVYPSDQQWIKLMYTNPSHPIFDIQSTPETEHAAEVLKISLEEALNLATMEFGTPESWNWSALTNIKTSHISGISIFNDFSENEVNHTGFEGTIHNLLNRSRNYGSTWKWTTRMNSGKAVSTISGISGVSSNPFSTYFDKGLQRWKASAPRTITLQIKNIPILDNATIVIYPMH